MVERPPSLPQRTCVGCRTRAEKTELIRFVMEQGRLTLDPAGRKPGRGAWLHPVQACLDLAVHRRAFGRALRTQVPIDVSAVSAEIEQHS